MSEPKKSAWSRLSPAAKDTQAEYNRAHYSVVGTKLPRAVADDFRGYCAARGRSVSSILAEHIYSVLATDSAGSADSTDSADSAGSAADP